MVGAGHPDSPFCTLRQDDIRLRASRLRRDKGKRACTPQIYSLRHSLCKCPLLPKWLLFVKFALQNQASHGDSKTQRKRRHGRAPATKRAALKGETGRHIRLRASRLRRDKGKRACTLQIDNLPHSLCKCPRLPKWPLFVKFALQNQASHGDS
jgi:hypothetical protein